MVEVVSLRPFYERPGLHTELYDVLQDADEPPIVGDVAFYDEVAKELGGPVLELGCGTGRVTVPLARAGHRIVGLDRSSAMLAVAEERRVAEAPATQRRLALVQGDMCDFDLGRRFSTVLIPFRSFQMLLSPAEERACLATVRRHLGEGGRLVVDIFDPLLDLLALESFGGTEVDWDGPHPLTGNRTLVEILGRRNDRLRQVLSQRWRFTEFADDGSVLRCEEELLQLRWLYRYEMRYLLELAGFEIEAEYSDFHRRPPAYGDEQIYVCRLNGA